MIKKVHQFAVLVCLFLFCGIFFSNTLTASDTNNDKKLTAENHLKNIYNELKGSDKKPDYKVFRNALIGYYHLKATDKLSKENEILTIVDFSKSSNTERLWVIDLKDKKVLFNTLVAHGRNTGDEYAANFSNLPNSFMSSIGFYVTGEIYTGKHGLSLRLDGQEKEFNSQARNRAVVMHGADYVSEDFIKKAGRLGRSLGCPAIPVALHKEIITTLADKTCLFVYHPDKNYAAKSMFSNDGLLANIMF
ncbi:murein L,D-transpeptidase catalytic domain family protein [soil metagenome]